MANRPLPQFPEADTAPFWDATKRRELTYQQCNRCNNPVFTPRAHCTTCGSLDLTWKVSSGAGTVYTYSVIPDRNQGDYTVAYIDLDEGFRMFSAVVGVEDPMNSVHCGQRVRVEFEPHEASDYLVPVFRPV